DKNRVREITVASLGLGLELLEHIVEVEDLAQSRTIKEHAVIGAEDRYAPAGIIADSGDRLPINSPLGPAALDLAEFARTGDACVGGVVSRDAVRTQTLLFETEARLIETVRGQILRVDPLGEIPHALAPFPARDRGLAHAHEQFQHPGDLIRAVPSAL